MRSRQPKQHEEKNRQEQREGKEADRRKRERDYVIALTSVPSHPMNKKQAAFFSFLSFIDAHAYLQLKNSRACSSYIGRYFYYCS